MDRRYTLTEMPYRPGCDCWTCDAHRSAILDAREPHVLTAPPLALAIGSVLEERRPLRRRLLARRGVGA